jgi:hypothetical protein
MDIHRRSWKKPMRVLTRHKTLKKTPEKPVKCKKPRTQV